MLEKFCRTVDSVNEWTGRISAWLIIPLSLIVGYDVGLRYLFNKPTVWAWDINVQLLGAMAVLGGGYVLLHNGHIGVDVLVTGLSKRRRAIVELATSVFFFLGSGMLVYTSVVAALYSVRTREVDASYFAPPMYPLKVVLAVGFFLLFLQGVVKFIRDTRTVLSKGERAVEQ